MPFEDAYRDCTLCPRRCHADRTAGRLGFCGADDAPRVARAALHFWEEPPISGESGSGTVFFAHCQLQCAYCQNARISRARIASRGNPWADLRLSADDLAEIFLDLERQGANNINLVSATQYLPTVAEAIATSRERGMRVPIVMNTGGYESVETIRSLSGLVDIYLVDIKHADPVSSARYAQAPDYPQAAWAALDAMVAQTGAPVYLEKSGGEEVMASGTIVRHLLLPGRIDEAEEVVRRLGTEYGDRIVVSLMSQYVPLVDGGAFPELAVPVDPVDYENLVDFSCMYDFNECFMQDPESSQESYIPDFSGEGVIRRP